MYSAEVKAARADVRVRLPFGGEDVLQGESQRIIEEENE